MWRRDGWGGSRDGAFMAMTNEIPRVPTTVSKRKKLLLGSLGCVVFLIVLLLYPLPVSSIPEWKIQVVDPSGKPVPGERVHEEWMDPRDEGMTYAMEAQTDVNGWALFPRHKTHVAIADLLFRRSFDQRGSKSVLPPYHAFVCMKNLDGDTAWDNAAPRPTQRLVLRPGSCGLD